MKRTIPLVAALIIIAVAWNHRLQPKYFQLAAEQSTVKSDLPSPLTGEEERDLQILVPQTLSWFAMWSDPSPCLWNDEIVKVGLATEYEHYKLQKVPMGLDISEKSLTVYFDSLHTYIQFKRLHKIGLSPGSPTFNCDRSYADNRAGIELRDAQTHPAYETASKRAEITNPELSKSRQHYEAANTDGKSRRNEIRDYFLGPLAARSPSALTLWTEQKKELYDKVLEVLRSHLKSSYGSGDRIEATIPGFELGDPAMYIYVRGHYYDNQDSYIICISFDRDGATGEYLAHESKVFGLPDEVRSLVPLIRKNQVAQLSLRSP